MSARPIDSLRRLVDQIRALGPDGEWLADGLEAYLEAAPRGGTLEAALGLSTAPGQRPWWSTEAKQDQRALIARAAREHLGHLKPAQQAREISREMRRYETTKWRSDRHAETTPPQYRGELVELLYLLMVAHGGAPSERQVRRILSDNN